MDAITAEFINETRDDIANGDLVKGNYCVILFTSRGIGIDTTFKVRCVYKDIDEFEAKVEKEIEGIDTMFGIDFETWIFD